MKLEELLNANVNEELRLRLLEEERRLRARQPEPWTKTKYRKYASFGRTKSELEQAKAAKRRAAAR